MHGHDDYERKHGKFAGLDRFTCRKAVIKELEESGIFWARPASATPLVTAIVQCPVEPMVTKQWFVRMKPLADRALVETQEGRVNFHPTLGQGVQ